MRKRIMIWCAAGVLALASVGTASAQTLEDAAVLEQRIIEICPTTDLEAALQEYAELMAVLVANGAITEAEALGRFQALRDAARRAGCGDAVDALFEELFPDTQFVETTGGTVTAGGSLSTGSDSTPTAPSPSPR